MAIKNTYKITINNWDKYNKSLKPGHKKIMISTGFLTDAKIRSLTPVTKLLYLSCLLVAGELTSCHIEVSHDSLVYQSGVKSGLLQSQLDQLQSLQLLTYEKVVPNRIEKKRKEDKVKEKKGTASPTEPPPTEKISVEKNSSTKEVIAHYCDEWKNRYGTNPPISGRLSGQIKTFTMDHGVEKSKSFISAYLSMVDSWFLTKRHDFPTLLANLNSVAHFAETGRHVTQREIREVSERVATSNLIADIERNGI